MFLDKTVSGFSRNSIDKMLVERPPVNNILTGFFPLCNHKRVFCLCFQYRTLPLSNHQWVNRQPIQTCRG